MITLLHWVIFRIPDALEFYSRSRKGKSGGRPGSRGSSLKHISPLPTPGCSTGSTCVDTPAHTSSVHTLPLQTCALLSLLSLKFGILWLNDPHKDGQGGQMPTCPGASLESFRQEIPGSWGGTQTPTGYVPMAWRMPHPGEGVWAEKDQSRAL